MKDYERKKLSNKKVADGRRTVLIFNSRGFVGLEAFWDKLTLTEFIEREDFEWLLEEYGQEHLKQTLKAFARGYAWETFLSNGKGDCIGGQYFSNESDARDWCWSQDV